MVIPAVLEDVFRDELEMSSQLNINDENYVSDLLTEPSQLTRRVDALYLLSLLLMGSQRSQVQEMLAKLGIGPLLSGLFEQFLWKYVSLSLSLCLFTEIYLPVNSFWFLLLDLMKIWHHWLRFWSFLLIWLLFYISFTNMMIIEYLLKNMKLIEFTYVGHLNYIDLFTTIIYRPSPSRHSADYAAQCCSPVSHQIYTNITSLEIIY